MEDELREPANFVDYMLPRTVRLVLLRAAALSCVVATGLGVARVLQDPLALSGAHGALQTWGDVGVNAAGAFAFGAVSAWDASAGGEKRIAQRKRVREAQIKQGIREVYVTDEGDKMSRLREVDDGLILQRLENWGRRDNMPFIGPEKAALLAGVVQAAQPATVVEVGTMAGYSALAIARALPPGGRVVSFEKDVWWWAAASRFMWQARQGADGAGKRVDVRLGDALQALRQWSGPGKIDLLFLDGVPKDSLAYLQAAESHLAPGATVVADNAGVFAQGGMREYLQYVRGSGRYESRTLECKLEWRDDVADALEVSRFLR